MRYLHYYYNPNGSLVFVYSGMDSHFTEVYMQYSLKKALRKFREKHKLQHKRIVVERLY